MASGSTSEGGQRAAEAVPRPSLGERTTLGKYTISRQIGAGGMGTVYLAVDTQLKRTIALKVLPRERAENETLVRRFEAEAQAAAQLKHENIVTIYDAGRIDGHLFIALEFVDGTDVYELTAKRGTLTLKRSLDFVKQVTHALDHLHKRGFVHRDIKPSNLLVTKEGVVKVTDMGLARAVDESLKSHITREGTTVGTVDYMSPEQARDSQAADIRSDIYSLGCTWYQMLTGEPPFPTGSVTNKLYAHISKPRPDPRAINRGVPEDVVAVMHKMMARKVDDRYATPAELLKELEALGQGSRTVDEVLQPEGEIEVTPRPTPPSGRQVSLPPRQSLRRPSDGSRSRPLSDVEETPSARKLPARQPLPGSATNVRPPAQRLPGRDSPVADVDIDRKPDPGTPDPGKPVPGKSAREQTAVPTKGRRSRANAAAQGSRTISSEPTASEKQQAQQRKPFQWWIDWDVLATRGVLTAAALIGVGLLVWMGLSGRLAINREADTDPMKNPFKDRVESQPPEVAKQQPEPKKEEKQPKQPEATRVVVNPANTAREEKLAAAKILGRPDERAKFPDWVAELWEPGAAPASKSFADLKTLTVGRVDSKPADCADLLDAINRLPAEGGIIELRGRGPFLLPPVQIAGRRQVIITGKQVQTPAPAAAPSPIDKTESKREDVPLIALVPGNRSATDSGILATDTSLTFYGVHLAAFADEFAGDNLLRLIHVRGGDLTLRNSSMTLIGNRSGSTTAFSISSPAFGGTAARPVRILLDQAFVRGGDLTALDVDLRSADLLAINSLFVTGKAPVLNLLSEAAAGPAHEAGAARTLRFFSCTACTDEAALVLHSTADAERTPPTQFQVLHSIFAVDQPQHAALISLAVWPSQRGSGDSPARLENLAWESKALLVCGWQYLLQGSAGITFGTTDNGDWGRFWGASGSTFSYQPAPVPPLSDFANLDPARFRSESFAFAMKSTGDSGLPGCDVARLAIPTAEIVRRADLFSRRPALPDEFLDSDAAGLLVKEIDLDNPHRLEWQDLGKVLKVRPWASGTRFKVHGTGNKICTPIQIVDKSLRIEFVDDSPPLLTFEARGGRKPFISITGGTIEIVRANFRIEPAAKGLPPWFLSVKDGSFSIRDSSIHGPPRDNPGYEGLIYFSVSATGTAQPKSGSTFWGHIRNSFLCTGQTVVGGNMTQRNVVVENSILASSGRIFEFANSSQPTASSALDLRECTLAAGRDYFHLQPEASGTGGRLRIFAEKTVFAPPVQSGGNANSKPVLLSGIDPSSIPERIEWWERACAYSSFIELPGAGRQGSDPVGAWQNLAGASHIVRSIGDANAVILRHDLGEQKDLVAGDFRLKEDAQAATWSDIGTAIGAQLKQVSVPAASKDSVGRAKEPVGRKGAATKKPAHPVPTAPQGTGGGL